MYTAMPLQLILSHFTHGPQLLTEIAAPTRTRKFASYYIAQFNNQWSYGMISCYYSVTSKHLSVSVR